MKTLIALIIIIIFIGGLYLFNQNSRVFDTKTATTNESVQVIPIEHASGILIWNGKNIYIDPVGDAKLFEGKPAADIILVTDIHGDHFSAPTLAAIGGNAVIIAPQAVLDQMPADLGAHTKLLKNGEKILEQGFDISAVPMYNLPDKDNASFHTLGRGNGYIIENNGFRVYIAGDTAGTPEMRALTNIDIAFIPMNLPYTMSIEEAADAVLDFKPKIVYPYHYRNKDGLSDVNKFKEIVAAENPGIRVVLGEWYKQ